MKLKLRNDAPTEISNDHCFIRSTFIGGVPAVEYGEMLPFGVEGDSVAMPRDALSQLNANTIIWVQAIRHQFQDTPQVEAWLDAIETGRPYAECLACLLAADAGSMDEAFAIERRMLRRDAKADARARLAEAYYTPEYLEAYAGMSA